MSDEPNIKPPYVGYTTFKNFIGSVKELIPARIDPTHPFMQGQSGSAQSFLMVALRFFGLIDGKIPTPELKRLAQSEGDQRKEIWKAMFVKAYAPIIEGIDLTNATAGMLHEKFREQGLTGETVNKCFSFFVAGAEEAGIPIAKHLAPGVKTGGNGSSRKTRKPKNQGVNDAPSVPAASAQPQDMKAMLLAKFPEFDPAWPEDLKKQWFDGYGTLLKASIEMPK